ncbi:MAG TPA: hypothetical protein VFU04_03370 [Solirubrobacterales bacterium]|nr:hypothetical protein [Solirubrobacterales bacterium]
MKAFVAVLIAVACLLALPAATTAATFTVDSVADEADAGGLNGICLSTGLKCTLRAAIEESNASTSVKDTVKFAALFNGQLADTIALTLGEIQITDEVTIDGDNGTPCTTEAAVAGPCAGVSSAVGLDVLSDDVEIKGMAITGAGIGIAVVNESTGFTATNNWLGVKLDGSAGPNTTGIFIDPGSDFASIGGITAADRNVFANNSNEGLDIEGASDAVVRGNFFGVAPNGTTQAANAKDIEITDSTAGGGFAATGNEVGRTIEGAEQASAVCDGGCNVISGATFTGLDLHGNGAGLNEAPASGPTTVHGNYVGLTAAGTAVVANATFGILAGGSDATTVGGPVNGDANFIGGGGTGIYHEDGEGFAAVGNVVGSSPSGDVTPPGLGVFVYCLNLGTGGVDPVAVEGNVLRMEGGVGIEAKFGNADIASNFIESASTGIFTRGDPAGAGNLIEDNVIGESTSNGILIENDFNIVVDNAIFGSGAAGVRIQDPTGFPILSSTGNLIGGDTKEDENTIRESGGDAIEIVDLSASEDEDSQNHVARNHGDENNGLFIDLVDAANGGILPPTIGIATQQGASGTAEPGATVRVFRKAEASPGEIEAFLSEATADGAGKWKVTYPAISAGTFVGATQTSTAGATSELAIVPAQVVVVDEGCAFVGTCKGDGGGSSGGGGASNGGGGGDAVPPQTTIVKGPKGKVEAKTARFRLSSSEPGSTFECKLDRKPFRKCKSPKKYKGLKPGKHVFKVRARDAAGNVDRTPAKRRWRIVEP